ncbi:camp-dependent protein kinase [Stylonychia lemnae]|uniref:Camp-dependent protein kinase n=1 Tax=Stylonychia lemnae TaxID=5949 RepID=A0A078AD25_STYLE|nr:camp-dependent protein kinase [Stylonychia lemnae]|eukprot:CDW79437.1 camp-dependent protein kinase [Stylonychia lemnae]
MIIQQFPITNTEGQKSRMFLPNKSGFEQTFKLRTQSNFEEESTTNYGVQSPNQEFKFKQMHQKPSLIERVKKIFPYLQENEIMQKELNKIRRIKRPDLPGSLQKKVNQFRKQTQTLSPIQGQKSLDDRRQNQKIFIIEPPKDQKNASKKQKTLKPNTHENPFLTLKINRGQSMSSKNSLSQFDYSPNLRQNTQTPIIIQNLTINNFNVKGKSRIKLSKEIQSEKLKTRTTITQKLIENFSNQLPNDSSSTSPICVALKQSGNFSKEQEGGKRKNDLQILPINSEQFQTIELAGEGHFGKVYKVSYDSRNIDYDQNKYTLSLNDGIYALKVINVQQSAQLMSLENIFNEKINMQKISDHQKLQTVKMFPNYFTSFTEQTNLFILMEYIDGIDLYKYQQEYLVDLDTAKYFSSVILKMIEFLHNQYIIYRDLKPENILIEKSTGNLKLIDFGLSKQLSRLQGKNRTQTKCGTPLYTAPEIAQIQIGTDNDDIQDYTFACDLWSWGVLLCEFIGGYNPFKANDVMQIYDNILKLRINWPKNIDNFSRDILQRVLVLDPSTRISLRDMKNHKFFQQQNTYGNDVPLTINDLF